MPRTVLEGLKEGLAAYTAGKKSQTADALNALKMAQIGQKIQSANQPITIDPNSPIIQIPGQRPITNRGYLSPSQNLAQEKLNRIRGFGNSDNKTPKSLVTTDYDVFGLPKTQVDIEAQSKVQEAKERAKGVPTSETGKYTFAQEAQANLPQVLNTLFPSGQPSSFRRDYAVASKTPRIGIGPFGVGGKALPFSKEGQNIRRWLGSAVAGKLLIQSGQQTNPAEYERLADQYLAGAGSDPEAIFKAINELMAFHQGYSKNLKSRGAEGQGYQAPKYTFDSSKSEPSAEDAMAELKRRGIKLQ